MYIHTVDYYSERKTDTCKTDDSQMHYAKWKGKTQGLYDSISMTVWRRQGDRDGEQTSGCQGAQGRGRSDYKRAWLSLVAGGNVLNLEHCDTYMTTFVIFWVVTVLHKEFYLHVNLKNKQKM